MKSVKQIHTLDARGHVFLEVMREALELNPDQMLEAIQGLREETATVLKAKGVDYLSLRSALTPSQDRHEVALIFDTLEIDDSWYGRQVFERVIPLLEPSARQSILNGDYLGGNKDQKFLERALRESVHENRIFKFRHSTQFFIVYLNNVTMAQIRNLNDGLAGWRPYIGFADTTYASPFKWLLSTMLVNLCVKFEKIIIQGHEDDRPDTENCNISEIPFEEHGYRCISLQSLKTGILLSYKIERPVLSAFKSDTEISLNAISERPAILKGFEVEVDERKLQYLKFQKGSSMNRASLGNVSAGQLAKIIEAKVEQSYIYNLSYLPDHDVTKFNIIVEHKNDDGKPIRLLAGLEYRPEAKKVRLITLY